MPSSALRLQDLRTVHRITGECRERGDDPTVWWRHLLEQAARLVDADVANGGETLAGPGGTDNSFGLIATTWVGVWGFAENGFPSAGLEWALAEYRANPRFDPFVAGCWSRVASEPGVPLTRPQLLPEAEWYTSAVYRHSVAPCGLDERLFCGYPLAAGGQAYSGFCVARAKRRRGFSDRECVRLGALTTAVVPLMGGPLARPGEPSPSDLPPRVRDVLRCLLEGDSDKQIAARLGISKHTVNQYVKLIFRHFGVTTRPELLARWIRRGWGKGFAW